MTVRKRKKAERQKPGSVVMDDSFLKLREIGSANRSYCRIWSLKRLKKF
jgi:hypothetical protein